MAMLNNQRVCVFVVWISTPKFPNIGKPSHLQAAVGHRNLGAVVLNKGCNIWWLHVAWVAGQRLHPQIQIWLHPKNDSKVIVLRVWQSSRWIFQLWFSNSGSGYLMIDPTNHIVSNIFKRNINEVQNPGRPPWPWPKMKYTPYPKLWPAWCETSW